MALVIQLIVGAAAILFFIWMIMTRSDGPVVAGSRDGGTLIDPNDSAQIGMLVGMTGGSIKDAATMRYALGRFRETYGRDATTEEIGMLIGLMKSIDLGESEY